MTEKEIWTRVSNGHVDIVQLLLDVLEETGTSYAVVDGIAVNTYAEPVVSLDLDIVVALQNVEIVISNCHARGLKAETYEHSVNLSAAKSDLRIQLQVDRRYQEFIPRSSTMNVLGYTMRVASVEDVLQGKVWAYQDTTRRRSKRQKDLADISRLIESRPELEATLPASILNQIQ